MRKLAIVFLTAFLTVPTITTEPIPPGEDRWIEAEKSISDESLMFISLPGRRWGFGLYLPRFKIEKPTVSTSGKTHDLYARGEAHLGRVMLTVFIEVDPRYNSVKPLLEDQWTDERKNAMGVTEFKSRIEGEMGRVDYVQTKAAEKTISLRNAHAYWVVDGCWIDVHVSIANFKPEEEQLFKLLFDTAVIYNGSDRGSLKELFHANALYYQKDYKKAAAAYESLLFGERLAQTLDTDRLRMATDNLGMAYGQLGDLKKSQATYETAIKQDPEYSGYHYNLACTLAEMDKLDEAIAELRLAYQFIANQIEGEKLPNPRTDDSFKRFMKNDKFLKALAEMEKGK